MIFALAGFLRVPALVFLGLESGKLDELVKNFLVAPPSPHTWRAYVTYFAVTALVIAVVLLGALLWNHSLRRQVRARTAQLTAALEEKQQEITERRRAEEALRDGEKRYRDLVENSLGLIGTHDLEGTLLSVNPAAAQMLGYQPAEMVGRDLGDFLGPDVRYLRDEYLERIRREPSDSRLLRVRSKSGEERVWKYRNVRIAEPGKAPYVLGHAVDITELQQAREALAKSEAKFRSLVESNIIGVRVADVDGGISEANEAFLRMVGYTQQDLLCGRLRWDQITPPEYRALDERAIAKLRASCACTPWEKQYIRKDGSRISALVGVAFLQRSQRSAICFALDITERKQLEEQLRQAQKMEAVGRLAGGIAHEFNNLLTVIRGYGELLVKRLGPAEPLRRNAQEIQQAADRAAALTQQLLAFSRKQVLQSRVLDLNAVVAETEQMLRPLIGEDIELVIAAGAQLGAVKADPGQIAQVLLNLAVNARDAMPQGGRLTITTARAG